MDKRVIKRVCNTLLFVAMVVSLGSCTVKQKLIRIGDPELLYDYALSLYEEEEWNKASSIFDLMEPYYVGQNREDSILFFNARSKFKAGRYQESAQKMDDFRRRFGRSAFLEDAEGIYTLCYYYMTYPATRDQSATQLSIITIDEFLSRYPESDKHEVFEELQQELITRLHEKSFLNAYSYYKIGKYKSAIVAFKNALKEYPESSFREQISYYTVASAYQLASNSVLSKKEDRYFQMLDNYISFIAEFPDSKHRKEVDNMQRKAKEYLDAQNKMRNDEATEEIIEE